MARKKVRRGPGTRQLVSGKDIRIVDEVRYVQQRAAEHTGCFVTLGNLVFFATDTGDAWMLDREDHLAARLARDGDPEEVHIEESDTRFAIGWRGQYRIDGDAFVYSDGESGRVTAILGYPVGQIAALG